MKPSWSSPPGLLIRLFLILAITQIASADVFTWNAKRQRSRLAEGREFTVLSGGAKVTSDSTVIVADEIELWGTDFRYTMARGEVTATDSERGMILESETLFYDREEEIIRVDGFIDMQDLKNDVVVRGGFFEYFGKDEIAHIQIGVRILKVDEDTELACRSEFARYLREEEILELSGMPKVTRNQDLYTASRITINLDTDEILLDRDVSGTLVTESEEEQPVSSDGQTPGEQVTPEPPAGEAQPEGPESPAPDSPQSGDGDGDLPVVPPVDTGESGGAAEPAGVGADPGDPE